MCYSRYAFGSTVHISQKENFEQVSYMCVKLIISLSVLPLQGKLRQETFTVHGHRDGGRTACPGDQYYELIQDWPNYGGSLHPSTEPTPFHPSTEPTPSGSDVARRPSCIAVALVVLMSCAASMRVA